MDLVRLGPPGSSSYTPDEVIEGYSSVIWTERFQTFGDFSIKTPHVKKMMELLPEKTLISHLDTRQVMMVDTHAIDSETGELTITGLSLDAFLTKRHVEAPYRKKRKLRRQYTPTGAAGVLIWNAVDNASGKDVTREDDYSWNTLDRIPNVAVTDSVIIEGATRRWWVEKKPVYDAVSEILIKGDMGLRVLRPVPGDTALVMTVQVTPLDDRGLISRDPATDLAAMRFDLYSGIDRSHEQSVNPRVSFNYLQGHIDKVNYLFSIRDYATALEILSSVNVADVYRNATERDFTGLDRHVSIFDMGDPDLPPEPEKPAELKSNATAEQKRDRARAMDDWIDEHAIWKNKRDRIVEDFKEDNADDALRDLKKKRRLSMIDGDISPVAPYQYGVHYNLGDTVSMYGEYGIVQKMVVDEYIRTEDAEGDRGFPGLRTP